jgi:hypothetical protein
MTILVANNLYAEEVKAISNTLYKSQATKFPKDIDLSLYKDVYLPIKLPCNDTQTKTLYCSCVYLALLNNNQNLLTELLKADYDPNINEIATSTTPLFIAIENLLDEPNNKQNTSIIKELLKNTRTNPTLANVINKETALSHLAIEGDKNLALIDELAKYEESFYRDSYGANVLVTALQYQQYETVVKLLQTQPGQALVSSQRADGAYPLDLCVQIRDPEQGAKILNIMLELVDANILFDKLPILFTVLNNPNPKCKLKYMEILLQHGVDPNLTHYNSETLLTGVVYDYLRVKEGILKGSPEIYLELIKLLLEYNADIFCEDKYKDGTLIGTLSQNKYGQTIIDLFKDFYKDNSEALNTIENHLIKPASDSNQAAPLLQTTSSDMLGKFHGEFQAILETQLGADVDLYRQSQLIALYENYTSQFPQAKELNQIQGTIILQLFKQLNCGTLTLANISKLIGYLNNKKNEFTLNIWWPYREYINKSLYQLSIIKENDNENKYKEKLAIIRDSYQYMGKLFTSFDTNNDEVFQYQLDDFNDLMQRIIRITLSHAEEFRADLGKFLDRLNKIPTDDFNPFDPQTRDLILQLHITHVYFKGDKNEYDRLYEIISSTLPKNHILFRQYEYWKVDLTFQEMFKTPHSTLEDGHAETLQKSLNDLKVRHPGLKKIKNFGLDNKLLDFKVLVANSKQERKQAKEAAKKQRNAENRLKKELATEGKVNEPVAVPAIEKVESNNNNIQSTISLTSSSISNSSSVTKDKLITPQAAYIAKAAENHPITVAREKRKQNGFKYHDLMIKNLEQTVARECNVAHQAESAPLYQESDIRQIFADALLPGENIKPINCWGVENVCWVVCRMPKEVDNYPGLRTDFDTQFSNATALQAPTSAGICCENKIYRLKLKAQDYRLHCSQVIRARGQRCFLVVFDTLWTHEKPFENKCKPDQYIDDVAPNKVSSDNSKPHHSLK